MSGKSKGAKGGKKETPAAASAVPQGPVYVDPKSGNVLIKIQAKPGAKTNGITDIGEEGVGVQIGEYLFYFFSLVQHLCFFSPNADSTNGTFPSIKQYIILYHALRCTLLRRTAKPIAPYWVRSIYGYS